MEIWKWIKEYENYFMVSNYGNFKSVDRIINGKPGYKRIYPGKTFKTEMTVEGYSRILLMKNAKKKRYMCHRLVASTFIPNPENKPFVNHRNGIRNDNRVVNLEWCTQSENELWSSIVFQNKMAGKNYSKKIYCKELDRIFLSMSETVRYIKSIDGTKPCIEGINKAIKAKRKYHGFTLSFVDCCKAQRLSQE